MPYVVALISPCSSWSAASISASSFMVSTGEPLRRGASERRLASLPAAWGRRLLVRVTDCTARQLCVALHLTGVLEDYATFEQAYGTGECGHDRNSIHMMLG